MANPRIEGLYELGHVLYALDAGEHGFGRADIEQIERYWTLSDMHSSTAGFVVRLRDGRGSYIELEHWHAFEQDEDFRIGVTIAVPDTPPGDWSREVAHLNRMLAA